MNNSEVSPFFKALILLLCCLLVGCSSSKMGPTSEFEGNAGADIDKGHYPKILKKGAKLRQKYKMKQSNFKVLSSFRQCQQDKDCIETNIATCNRGCPCAFSSINLVKRQKFYRFRKYVCYGYSAENMCVCDSSRSGMVPKCVQGLCTLQKAGE